MRTHQKTLLLKVRFDLSIEFRSSSLEGDKRKQSLLLLKRQAVTRECRTDLIREGSWPTLPNAAEDMNLQIFHPSEMGFIAFSYEDCTG